MRVAVVHDWLVTYAGAERVLEQMLAVFPQADLFSLVDFLPPGERGFILDKSVRTSFIQNLPRAKRSYRSYLPLMPLAIEQFDLTGYDLVVSSSHAVAKGVITGPDQLHVCMCYSPMRYAWDLQYQYLREADLERGFKGGLTRAVLHYLRIWDSRTAVGVDCMIAISEFIRRRIRRVYGKDSIVIYPPVDINGFQLCTDKENYYLTASRMVPYKRIDLIVEAFVASPHRQLIVIGDGPESAKVRSIAGSAPNIRLLGYQPFEVLREHMQRAKAFVFAAEEDFGIAPLEAQACGTPVVAFGKGGALETVVDGVTGVFFNRQSSQSLLEALERFEQASFDARRVRQNAERFSAGRFRAEFEEIVARSWAEFKGKV